MTKMDKYFGKLSEECGKKATPAKKKKTVAGKYSESYLQFGFILIKDLNFSKAFMSSVWQKVIKTGHGVQ